MKRAVAVLMTLFLASGVFAADYTWDGGGADDLWSTGANWVGDFAPVSGSTGKVFIQSGNVEMGSEVDVSAVSHLYLGGIGLGSTGDATLTVDGGAFYTSAGYAILGYNTVDTGTLNVNSGSTMTFNGDLGLGIGWYGKGVVDINGGTVNAARLITSFKSDCPGDSSLTIRNGGTLNINGYGRVGNFDAEPAAGTLADNIVIDNGSLNVSSFLIIGVHNTTNLTLSGTGSINVGGNFQISAASYSQGLMTMTGGTVDCANLLMGSTSEGYGELNLLGGTITADTLTMNTSSVINIAGGTLILAGEVTNITSYGNVLAYNGTGYFVYDYDLTNNVTTITASEEPGTIVFVDADLTNTTVNGDALVNGVNYADGSNSIIDDLWGTRDRTSVNGGFIWTTDAPASSIYAEATSPLVTTITIDGPAGEYRVFGTFYISQQGTSLWDCGFSLDGEDYLYCDKYNSSLAKESFFTEPILVADVDGTGYLFIVQIGTVTTTQANEQVSVYVQGVDNGDTDNRSWFEGIAYQDASEANLIPEPIVYPDEPDIQPGTIADVTLNKKDTGFRGVWYYIDYSGDAGEYVYKYSGGLGTYCTRHRPLAVYRPEVDKTFFCYGGTSPSSNEQLWHMAASYDHQTGEVSMPTVILDKKTNDAHDNPVMSVDGDGYIWVFSTSHGTGRASYIHKSKLPYDIDEFELVESTKIDSTGTVVPFTNFSYFQPWSDGADGFYAFLTIYNDPAERTIQFMKTTDGVNWSQLQKISIAGRGAYQMSGQYGNKLVTAFNYHPNGEYGHVGLDSRVNLYVVQTLDGGQTWQTVDGTPVSLPLETPDVLTTPMLVKNYMTPEWRNVYLNDLVFDDNGNPVVTYITTSTAQPGPEGGPRYWEIARWDGTQWIFSTIGEVDHGFDGGSLYMEDDGTWRVIGAFVGGPQPYGTGGEFEMYTSADQGATWTKVMDVTSNSPYNHTHIRRPLNAKDDFYGFWADGHSRELSESNIYYCDKAGNVTQLPRGTGPAANPCDLISPEDLNKDCEVNLEDFAEFAGQWQLQGDNLPVEFEDSGYTGAGIDDSFEVASIGEIAYTLTGDAPTVSTGQAFSGSKSLHWASDVYNSYYYVEPFGGASLSNSVVSVQVYLPETNTNGRCYFSVMDDASNPVMLIVDYLDGDYDILYRIGSAYTRPIQNIGSGWHQLSFVIHADNAVGVYLDDKYLDTATNFTTGLNSIKFGKPWVDFSGIDVYYDDLKVSYNTDVIGGGSSSFGDVYEDFEYYGADGFSTIGGYAYSGNPVFSNVIHRSASQVVCTADNFSTKMTKVLPETMYNCRVSAWIYVPYVNSGHGYLRATDNTSSYAFVGVNPNPDKVYYRFEVTAYTGYDISKGWHLMSIIVDYQGHFHFFFDNDYLGTYTGSTGLNEVSFGNPWSTPGYAAYDSLSIVQDIRGGFVGDWNTVFNPGDFNQDGVNNRVDLFEFTDKWLSDAEAYVEPEVEPAIYLTFDDRFVSQWVEAMPIFDQYDAKATFCVTYFDTLSQSQIDGLQALKTSGHAVACHGLRHLKAVDYVNLNSIDDYWLDEIEPALNEMALKGFDPACFAYPYSQNDERTDQLLLGHFKYLRSGVPIDQTNKIFNDPAKMEAGCAFYGTAMDSNRVSLSSIYALMDEAISKNASIVFYGHNIADSYEGHYTTPQRLHDIISYGQSLGFEFKALDW